MLSAREHPDDERSARALGGQPLLHRMAMHRVDERLHIVGRRVLADAMAEIEDVRGAGAFVGERNTETVEYLRGLGVDLRGFGEQDVRVEVALQRLACAHERSRL